MNHIGENLGVRALSLELRKKFVYSIQELVYSDHAKYCATMESRGQMVPDVIADASKNRRVSSRNADPDKEETGVKLIE